MREVVIASAVRTAIGKFGGTLSKVSAAQLGEIVIKEVLTRAKIRPDKIDEVIMGNVLQAGLGRNSAGQAAVRAGISQYSPSFTVSKVCGAGMKALIMAAQTIKSGDADIIVAGGMENMSAASFFLPQTAEQPENKSEEAIITSSTLSGLILALARTSFITNSPNSSAGTDLKPPPNPPMAVRTALAITTSRIKAPLSSLFLAQVLDQNSDVLVLILMDIFYEIFQGSYLAEAILFKSVQPSEDKK